MEGRAIARPNPPTSGSWSESRRSLQWRAEQSLGQTALDHATDGAGILLQWRAEQSLGQTGAGVGARPRSHHPSMEGRAIARPNPSSTQRLGRRRASFNGGPSNRSAKPGRHRRPRSGVLLPSMEGRAIARPNRQRPVAVKFRAWPRLQWRAEQSLGQTAHGVAFAARVCGLQWRAEQSLGQTRLLQHRPDPRLSPSMEGRAIARPNRAADPRPVGGICPSMEGRAIARPNCQPIGLPGCSNPPFNGGPSNRSAKPAPESSRIARPSSLQWRAEQSLGQTRCTPPTAGCPTAPFNGGPSNRSAKLPCPSTVQSQMLYLQWRAEQSLGQTGAGRRRDRLRLACLQWRAEQSLGQTFCDGVVSTLCLHLQWRAEQSLGQTVDRNIGAPHAGLPSMEGRAIARPNAGCEAAAGAPHDCPSMEGRAIARPNDQFLTDSALAEADLQWRAEQSLGQTSCSGCPADARLSPFNGGPSNRSAKLDGISAIVDRFGLLQWRAEQSLGQTSRPRRSRALRRFAFNGGPSNRSAKPSGERRIRAPCSILQWRAEQSLGQTAQMAWEWATAYHLQWRAEQSLGQTTSPPTVIR